MNLAPNGKPSNLNPEQYKLVRTPEFKEWFGDWENSPESASKVIDENGEPLVVYHGSANNFTVFNKSKIGLNFIESENGGFFFTQKKQTAENYAFLAINGINKGFIYQCFLNIKNPINRNTNSEYYCPADRYDISRDEYIRILFMNKKLNGIIIIGTKKDNLYVVLKPNQIKLADGTNTTFDSNNPDIRYSNGGSVRPFTDDGNKLVVFSAYRNYEPYKIAVNNINNADYITLWKTDTNTGKDKKVGALKLENNDYNYINPTNLLMVSYIEIDKSSRGLGLGLEMYKVALKYSSDNIKGIKSYLPDRVNKRQIPKIYKALNAKNGGDDYAYIYKADNLGKFKKGGAVKNLSKTPAPKKDRIYGSSKNKPKSSESKSKASSIILSPTVLKSINTILKEHNEDFPKKKVPLSTAKAVVRRGMGAFSSSYRPTISEGKPNSRVAWGLARLKAFVYKIQKGHSKSGKYKQDNDLIQELGYKYKEYKNGGEMELDNLDNLYKEHHEVWAKSEEIIKNVCEENCSKYSTEIYNLYETDLKAHFVEEEQVFFPSVINENNKDLIKELIREHHLIKFLVQKIRLSKRTKDIKDFCNLMIEHIRKEELIMKTISNDPYKNKAFKNGGLTMKVPSQINKMPSFIAPNGERSNLYQKAEDENGRWVYLYDIVRTAAFKNWFGDWEEAYATKDYEGVSKIIDENGEPSICYHVTSNEFYEFDENYIGSKTDSGYYGKGFYFTEGTADSHYGEREIPCFLNIQNPYLKQSSYRTYEINTEDLKNKGYDGLIVFSDIENVDLLKGLGYHSNRVEEIVAYYPEQIKLADGTNRTFDKYDSDIRYNEGGKIPNFDIESREGEEDRTTISLKGIGEVVLVETFPEYEFTEDIDEDTLDDLGLSEGDMIGKIEHIEIKDEYKGKGYAKLLMKKAIELAKEKGLMPLYLNASPMGSKRYGLSLEDLTGFYESFGFKVFLNQGNNNLMILKEEDYKFNDGGNIPKFIESSEIDYSLRYYIPNVRGGWTKEKIRKVIKSSNFRSAYGKHTINRLISEFDSPEDFKEHIFYHGTSSYVEGALLPSITMSERDAERYGGGGYGDRYWSISLSKSKNIASNFTALSRSGKVYAVILKKGANVISMPEIKDSAELEDIIEELWTKGIDAVWIGGGEQELSVLNPRAIFKYDVSERFMVYGKERFENLTDEQIAEIYYKSKENVIVLDKIKTLPKEQKENAYDEIKPFKFNEGGSIPMKEEYKYFLVIKNQKPVFKVKFSEYRKETERDMSEMLDKLHDMDYSLKPITEQEYKDFDYSTVDKEDIAEFTKNWSYYKNGGKITDEKKETYKKWKSLVNMSSSELNKFLDSEEGKVAGLSRKEANELGIDYGRESARWILRMKDTPYSEWTPNMWRWAKKQISFISRMSGNKGKLFDENGKRTRKYLSLLVWGNNPLKK